MQNDNTKPIVATNLYDMLVEVQSAVKQGFVISEKNEYFPQSFIGLYTCTMVKDVAKEETNVANQETLSKLPTGPSVVITEQDVPQGITEDNKAATEPTKQVTKRGRKQYAG
jgi:hypothetical protein